MQRSESRIWPGVMTVALGLLVWEGISLFFPPVVFPGPLALLDRMQVRPESLGDSTGVLEV